VGSHSVASGTNASAYGAGAQAGFINSAAFGAGATTTRANQQVFGTATNTYTLPGVTSTASTAAQSGSTQVITTDASGNLAAAPISSLVSSFDPTAINARLDSLDRRSGKAFTGVAMAFAMAGVPTVLPSEKFVIATNWGTFQGENGAALSAAVRIYHNVQLNGSFAYGFRENIAGGRAGLRFGF
jgi:autotransporter adhesin